MKAINLHLSPLEFWTITYCFMRGSFCVTLKNLQMYLLSLFTVTFQRLNKGQTTNIVNAFKKVRHPVRHLIGARLG